jgi:uncharacterized integral membrane protein
MIRNIDARTIPAMLAGFALLLLILQNGEAVTVRFLWFEWSHSAWLTILVSGLLGMAAGASLAWWIAHRHRQG